MLQATNLYQIGGSLPQNAPTYVVRQADFELYEGLSQGELCYVLSSRQMGKSSLLVRTMQRLQQDGRVCATIDLSDLGNQQISLDQWYGGVAYKLLNSLNLFDAITFMHWWQEHQILPPVQRLSELIEQILLAKIDAPIVIFIDEIDSILGFKAPLDDFFALIRACYQRRVQLPVYDRLTFALVGVATPSDLIADPHRTPFNIGRSIELQSFTLSEAQPLAIGLAGKVPAPELALQAILDWTGGQPFLTQKLCRLLALHPGDFSVTIAQHIAALVHQYLIENWELQDVPVHLKTIRDRLTRNPQTAGRLLGLYERILHQGSIPVEATPEQVQLRLSGLVIVNSGHLQIHNQLYSTLFNLTWVEQAFASLRPYAESIIGWLASGKQDDSYLLRGQSLQSALNWTSGKHLSVQDYQFLTASQEAVLTEAQHRETQSHQEIDRLHHEKELLEQLHQEQKRRQVTERALRQAKLRQLSSVAGAAISITSLLIGMIWVYSTTRAADDQLNTLSHLSEALLQAGKPQAALVASVKAGKLLQQAIGISPEARMCVLWSLQQVIDRHPPQSHSLNPSSKIIEVAQNPQGAGLAIVTRDSYLLLQTSQSQRISIPQIQHLSWSRQQDIATVQADGRLSLWNIGGQRQFQYPSPSAPITALAWRPDGYLLATGDRQGNLLLWNRQGQIMTTWNASPSEITGLNWSPDGQYLALATAKGQLLLWQPENRHLLEWQGHTPPIIQVRFNPSGSQLASIAADGTVRLWGLDGTLQTILSQDQPITFLEWHPDGQTLVTATRDRLTLWYQDGALLKSLPIQDVRWLGYGVNSDQLRLVTGTSDIILLDFNLTQLLTQACYQLNQLHQENLANNSQSLCDSP